MKKPSLVHRVRNRFPVKQFVDRLPLDRFTVDQEELVLNPVGMKGFCGACWGS